MNIPLIVDVAISLIFIYLVLSLLASQVQELIATLLDWRAKDLRKSIEELIHGGTEQESRLKKTQELVDRLYKHPLIKTFGEGTSSPTQSSTDTSKLLTRKFGKKADRPTCISGKTFATSLMETLEIKKLANILTARKFKEFNDERLEHIKHLVAKANLDPEAKREIDDELHNLSAVMEEIVKALKEGRIDLEEGIDSLNCKLGDFVEIIKDYKDKAQNVTASIERLIKEHFGSEYQRNLTIKKLKPSISQVVEVIRQDTKFARDILEALKDEDSETYKGIQAMIKDLPEPIKKSLTALGQRIQTQAAGIQEDLNQFEEKIGNWFDASQETVTKVYKRNAKWIALLLGCFIAFGLNADTLNIVSRLSNDSVMRGAISAYAEEFVQNHPQDSPKKLRESLKKKLETISLPIGWTHSNLEGQESAEQEWSVPCLRRIIGWLISGVAISMGSSFWFDLLKKVANVKNTGKK